MKRGGSASLSEGKAGFTIVETLIVLAVTSALLVSAMIAMGGRQAKTEFSVGSRQLRQSFQSEINKIGSGYYASQGNFTCSAISGTPIINPGVGIEQGTNGSCVLLGTALVIGGGEADQYTTYSIAGARENPTFGTSGKKVVEQTKEVVRLPRGFTFVSARLARADGTGDITWPASTEGVFTITYDLSLLGTDAVSVQPLVLHSFGDFLAGPVDAVNGQAPIQVKKADLCFVGSTSQSVLVTIGGEGGTSLTSQIFSTENCT